MPIVARLLRRFSTPSPTPLPEPDARLALGALMVRVAKSDQKYLFEEISQIDRLLAQFNGLNPVEAAKMRADCERLNAQAPDTDEFAKLIRETVSIQERRQALRALWQVVLADGVFHNEETAVLANTRQALGLSIQDSAEARTQAENA